MTTKHFCDVCGDELTIKAEDFATGVLRLERQFRVKGRMGTVDVTAEVHVVTEGKSNLPANLCRSCLYAVLDTGDTRTKAMAG